MAEPLRDPETELCGINVAIAEMTASICSYHPRVKTAANTNITTTTIPCAQSPEHINTRTRN